ncbi:MAG: gamma-glutamyltransferase [Proteobacteria bacterium]|nr:gamma-glutamyltransferase [Pseudomonadota bacterium]
MFSRLMLGLIPLLCLVALSPNEVLAASSADVKTSANIGPGGRPVGQAWSRSPVYAANGMAATAQPLASQIAIDILKAGGTAVDAAIAANAALGLMEPTGNGIGGDLFAIVWDPKTAKLHGLNASGRSPQSRSLERLKEQLAGADSIPPLGHLPVTVPGTVDGWFELHQRFGNLPMQKVLAPAIQYAKEGFPVSPVIAYYFQRAEAAFTRRLAMIDEFDNAKRTYFTPRAPKTGQIFRNPDLAETYSKIASEGRDVFYKGAIAKTIDAYMQRIGGDLRLADFVAHKSEWVTPGCAAYRDAELCELPPNGQGFAALQMVNILKHANIAQFTRDDPRVWHYLTEAKRLAFEDVAKYYADPDFADVPTEWLLSEAYGKARFDLIDPAKAMAQPQPGEAKLESTGDTTYLTVADRDGMMVSLIQSNYRGMGSGLVPDGLGFMLQDRGELFSLDPDHANVYAPGKRPFHTIIPAFLMRNGKPLMSFGLMGGSMQPQGHVQILINMIDYGMNPQEAGDAARMNHSGGRQPTGNGENDLLGTLYLEPGVSAATVKALKAMGHRVEIVKNGVMFGGYQAIYRDPKTGVYAGATEMRKDGLAIGY